MLSQLTDRHEQILRPIWGNVCRLTSLEDLESVYPMVADPLHQYIRLNHASEHRLAKIATALGGRVQLCEWLVMRNSCRIVFLEPDAALAFSALVMRRSYARWQWERLIANAPLVAFEARSFMRKPSSEAAERLQTFMKFGK